MAKSEKREAQSFTAGRFTNPLYPFDEMEIDSVEYTQLLDDEEETYGDEE